MYADSTLPDLPTHVLRKFPQVFFNVQPVLKVISSFCSQRLSKLNTYILCTQLPTFPWLLFVNHQTKYFKYLLLTLATRTRDTSYLRLSTFLLVVKVYITIASLPSWRLIVYQAHARRPTPLATTGSLEFPYPLLSTFPLYS